MLPAAGDDTGLGKPVADASLVLEVEGARVARSVARSDVGDVVCSARFRSVRHTVGPYEGVLREYGRARE